MIPTSPRKKVILCIDDDDAILRYEKALLERHGYDVLTASSGEQGLRLVAMCHCDAVLLDYEMPGPCDHPPLRQRCAHAGARSGGCFRT